MRFSVPFSFPPSLPSFLFLRQGIHYHQAWFPPSLPPSLPPCLQVAMPIKGLDPTKELVVVPDIHEDLGVVLGGGREGGREGGRGRWLVVGLDTQ